MRAILIVSAALLCACGIGPLRPARVDALGPYRSLPVKVEPARGVPAPTAERVSGELANRLEGWNARPERSATSTASLVVVPEVVELKQGTQQAGAPWGGMLAAANALRLGFDDASRAELRLHLFAPGERAPIGELWWKGVGPGDAGALLDQAANESGEALAKTMSERAHQFATRTPGDERFLLAPNALLLEPGEVVLGDDEVLMFHLAVGVTPWLELSFSLGGLPLPAAGSFPIVGHGVGGVGGAGVAVAGAVDLGLRVRLVEEGPSWPGVAAGYHLLDAFGAALGGAGIFFAGNGVVGAAGAGAAGVNVQLNVFHVEANKHFGPLNVGAGAALFDNHHFLPQSAGFVLGLTTGAGAGSSTPVAQLPEVFVPFVDLGYTPVRWFTLSQEFFPQAPFSNSFGATGVRFVLGSDDTWGPIALYKLRLKLDLGVIESYHTSSTPGRGGFVPLPWLGVGLYFL